MPDTMKKSASANLLPPKVCDEGFDFQPDPSVESLSKGQSFRVVLGEVFSLDEFYIIFLARVDSLKIMMADLNEFYKQNGERYKIPIALVSPDLYCVCPSSKNSEWHRARIMNFSPTLMHAKVRFIDYGTVEFVSVFKLRLLHFKFARQWPFAVPAKLLGIRQIRGDVYEHDVSMEFHRLYGNCDLQAVVGRNTPHRVESYLLALDDVSIKFVHEDLILRRLGRPSERHSMCNNERLLRIIMQMFEIRSKSPSSLIPELPQIASKPTPSPRLPKLPVLVTRKPSSNATTPSPAVSAPPAQQFPTLPWLHNPMMSNPNEFPFFKIRTGPAFRMPLFPVMNTEQSSGSTAPPVTCLTSPLPITPAPPAYSRDHVELTPGIVCSDVRDPVGEKDSKVYQQAIEEETVLQKLEKILEMYLSDVPCTSSGLSTRSLYALEFIPREKAVIVSAETDASVEHAPAQSSVSLNVFLFVFLFFTFYYFHATS